MSTISLKLSHISYHLLCSFQTLGRMPTTVGTSTSASLSEENYDRLEVEKVTKSSHHIRYLIVGLICLGSFTGSMSRSLMNTAILAMTPQVPPKRPHISTHPLGQPIIRKVSHLRTALQPDSVVDHRSDGIICGDANVTDFMLQALDIVKPEFDWSEQQQNLIMGAFAVGYVAALVPSGRIIENYGPMGLAVIGGFGHVALNLLGPWAARTSYWLLFGMRIFVGSSSAALVPTFIYIITRWVPDDEKSKAIAAMSVGGSLGTIFLNLVSGALCESIKLDGGWPSVFYVTGLLNLIWLLLWCYLVRSNPADHRWMTPAELVYISSNISLSTPRSPPAVTLRVWVRMVLSPPVLAMIYVRCTHAWFFNMLSTKIATYVIAILRMNLQQTAVFNTVYTTAQLFSVLFCGVISDLATRRQLSSRTFIRKCFESVATFGTSVFMICVAQTWCNQAIFLLFLSLAVACAGASIGGSGIVILDLTTDHASTLVAIVNTITMCFGFATPSLVTLLLSGNDKSQIHEQWNVVFYITSVFYVSGGLVFLIFGSAERQHWFRDMTKSNIQSKSMMSLYNRQNSSIFGESI